MKKTASILITTLVSGLAMADGLQVTTLAPDKPASVATTPASGPLASTVTTPPQLPAVTLPVQAKPTTVQGIIPIPTSSVKPSTFVNPALVNPIVPTPSAMVNQPETHPTGLHITPIVQKHKKYKKHKPNPDEDTVAPFFDIPENRWQANESSKKSDQEKPASKPYEVTLPGLGKVSGDPLLTKAVVLRVNGDGTEIVQISDQFQNRISTPFETPKVIDSSDTEFKISGSNIFLSTPSNHPVVIYVTGSERNDPVLSLTLVPKPIPAQTIILQLDPSIAVQSSPKGHHEHKPETYEQHLAGLLKTLASGDTPEGFTTGNISNIVGRKGPMIINPVSRYSNAYLDIFVYQAQNAGNPTINLSETSFYQKGVRAVGMYPLSTLRHADKTYVYVISDKTALENK
ncbi:type-F conjugative transfer system secretin TraK [Ferrovum sp.]|uniref:TraK domain-containing protein n=1 Tax=Ferrovum sp. TaxID=2609467 RepID=UPI0026106A7E|nr:type-F conjugative transfer system secretin TraK [Ferrovum sp.]